MANNKIGLGYYNIDTDRYMDIRIKRLKKDFGCAGIAVYDYILCEIYRVRGCFLEWGESSAFDVAEYWGLKESLVNEIVNYCCVVGLFDKGLLASGRVLTSKSIQSRYVEMCKRAKRTTVKIPTMYNIIPEECPIIPEECPIIPEESPIIPVVCRKVKYSKVKKEKDGEKEKNPVAALAATLPNRRKAFMQDCAAYVQAYGKATIRAFFDYWTELNKSQTKMRFELEKTWELSKRLSTWAKRDKDFSNSNNLKRKNDEAEESKPYVG
jgi:hypothetical protein